MTTKKCLICGREFDAWRKSIKYCSPECAKEGERQKNRERNGSKPLITAYCSVCGEEFTQKHGLQMYCSPKCRGKAKRGVRTDLHEITKKPHDPKRLVQITSIARAKGMTYGQYQAQKYIKSIGGIKWE